MRIRGPCLAISIVLLTASGAAGPLCADDGLGAGQAGECSAEQPLFGQPDVDVRAFDGVPSADQLAAAERLRADVAAASRKLAGPSELTLRWSGYGTPKMLRNPSGFLTPPSTADPIDIVLDFLASNAELYGLTEDSLARLELIRAYPTRHNGATHVGFRLTDDGRPVFGSIVTATVDADGRIVLIGGSYDPWAAATNDVVLDARAAVARALQAVGVDAPTPFRQLAADRGVAFANDIAVLREAAPLTAELVTFPLGGEGEARVAWRTVTEVDATGHYESIIDAETGELLYRRNLVVASAEGNVYRVQNPTLGSQQITPFVGVHGSWVDDRTTAGNNAIAYHDLNDTDTVGYQPETPASSDPNYQHFNYTYTDAINTSGGTDWNTDRDAVITQAFYFVNMLHDYTYMLGFDEAAGNFQEDNFSLGGLGSDRVLVEVDNGAAIGHCCNAFMGTPADGGNPRLTLRIGLAPDNLNMHRAMNGDTVTHEFGHGVSSRLVNMGSMGSGVQTGALAEGWSDGLATHIWDDPVYGEYNNGNTATGIRGVAYDTSTMVYSDLCSWSGGCGVHNDGRIWATMMWQLRAALIDAHGQAAGTDTHAQLMIDGMKNTPGNASFLDARDGYLGADVTNNSSANQCLLWRVFAEREMGEDATTVNNSSSVTAGTAVPAACVPVADAGGPYLTQEGQPVTVTASASTEATDPSGGPLSYAWDLDNDGQFDDATGVTASFTRVGQDGGFIVALQVTNAAGISDTDSAMVTVTNVAPTVTISATQVDTIDEGQTLLLSASFSDPGWQDTYTYQISWGTPAGDTSSGVAAVTTEGGPGPDLGAVTGSLQYGDNGGFLITVTVYDDDSSGTDSFTLTVNNVAPSAIIDLSGTMIINGIPTVIAHAGEDIPFSGDSADPGSDDLTLSWDWDDGVPAPDVSTTYLLDDPNPDPLPSPSVDPRDVTDAKNHTFGDACLYEVGFQSWDDDGGMGDDSLIVIIAGNAELTRSAGYWYQAYRRLHNRPFEPDEIECFLDIVGFMSTVFNEETSAATVAEARDILAGGTSPSIEDIFDRQLLAAWLNFANGAIDLDTMVDIDGDTVPDASFADIVTAAEEARLNPATTPEELEGWKDILELINEGSL
jgi:hypothetical protein